MKVRFHPEFPVELKRFEADYHSISSGLAQRFRAEILAAIEAVKASPGGSGHFVNTGSQIVREFRRRNLPSFPFFILYGVTDEMLIFGGVIPSRSDPVTWLARMETAGS
jgi:hypothetical protein